MFYNNVQQLNIKFSSFLRQNMRTCAPIEYRVVVVVVVVVEHDTTTKLKICRHFFGRHFDFFSRTSGKVDIDS